MSTWEERMAARAQERTAAEREREFAEEERERLAWEAEQLQRNREEFEAGPPDGCHDCWSWEFWATDWMTGPRWHHVGSAVVPGPASNLGYHDLDETHYCHHACHGGEPVYVIAPPMAAL